MIRHIVALRFRAGVSPDRKAALYAKLAGLQGRIDGLAGFRSFANCSVELPLVRGFNDVFWFDMRDAAVRDAYLADSEHQQIGAEIVSELDGGAGGVFVFDLDMTAP
ncbi:Dabb family protein [Pseudogemmobacter bohemicus]|uniref:Dabb family protein n=1 Tax=Pseudogemmobacter bohemicus TaxID=2250708 RepID=UPI000DD44EB0|nr:Dabb family protein [Pseudogemmobacter bohemicus]